MKLYKNVIPYLILGSTIIFSSDTAQAQNTQEAQSVKPYNITESRLIARAENTRDMYIDNMLAAQKRLNPKLGKRGYVSAVQKELPGAPVGKHCMYGQYTQLMRALNENGDTLTIIPQNGKSACTAFKENMQKKYRAPEYAGTIKEGHAFESDAEYNAALEKYLKKCGITDSLNTERYNKAVAEFAKRNFSLAHINPGSIMIVPRFRGSKTKFHAIMFLGEGRIESGEFVPDATGKYIFTAHNSERIGDLAANWDMSNVFCADIEKILQIEYSKELQKLESLSLDKMIEYISAGTTIAVQKLKALYRTDLVRLVQAKYFGEDVLGMLQPLLRSSRPISIPPQSMLRIASQLSITKAIQLIR